MRPQSALTETVTGLGAPHVIGRRTIDPTTPYQFTATMRNDFMTPRGTPYKWQDMRGALVRTVSADATPTVAQARYMWQDVTVRTGTNGATPDTVPWKLWNFARGQSFNTLLLHSDVGGGYVADNDQPGWNMSDVRYPDLPKSPAVDLLLMLSWDVLLFEALCTHLGTTPALERTGVTVNLDRHSGTGGELLFSSPTTAAHFRNNQMYAVKLGYCTSDTRPTGVYTFSCLDCELTTRAGPTVQKGRSSYWGMVQIDLLTGDLVLGEFTEVIVGTFADGKGRELPIYRRRLVRLHSGDVALQADPPAAAVPAVNAPPPKLVAEARDRADRVYERVREHLASLGAIPDEVKPLADIGFRSMVGTDYQGALDNLAELRAGLAAWVDGDPAIRARLAAHLRVVEGLLAYCKVSVDEAVRLGPAKYVLPLERVMASIREELGGLLVVLERFDDEDLESR